MKIEVKKNLEKLGLLSVAKKVVIKARVWIRKRSLRKYRDINRWHLKYGDVKVLYDTSDWYSKGWFFPRYDEGEIHEPLATNIFIDRIKRDSIVVDIGGHLGYFSCLAGHLAKEGKVYVFEVDPKCIGLIEKNVDVNNLKNVAVYNYAVSDSNGLVRIPDLDHPNPGLVINSKSATGFIEIESIALDDFLDQHHVSPDFIKIDVEGAEWMVLNGMKKTLKNSTPIILLEIHTDNLRKLFSADYKDLIRLLKDNGFSVKEIKHRNGTGKHSTVDPDTSMQGNTMILCEKRK